MYVRMVRKGGVRCYVWCVKVASVASERAGAVFRAHSLTAFVTSGCYLKSALSARSLWLEVE